MSNNPFPTKLSLFWPFVFIINLSKLNLQDYNNDVADLLVHVVQDG